MSRCDCGAPDCPRCSPQNFKYGRYIYVSCEKCGSEFPGDSRDGKLCEDCEREAAGIKLCSNCGEEFKPTADETKCAFCIEDEIEWARIGIPLPVLSEPTTNKGEPSDE